MRVFISYARVDKPICMQVAENLDIHDVWFDTRIYAGQFWWSEIVQRLGWCDVFLYLLSRDALSSDYCRREYDVIRKLNKPVVPVLIEGGLRLPQELSATQYVDCSQGLSIENIRHLLNSLYLIEKSLLATPHGQQDMGRKELFPPREDDPLAMLSRAADAMQNGQFDNAVFLLKRLITMPNKPLADNTIETLLVDAERALRELERNRERDLRYQAIGELIKRPRTRQTGCQSLRAFVAEYPGYDPDNLAAQCGLPSKVSQLKEALDRANQKRPTQAKNSFDLPLLDWVYIPPSPEIASFYLARYPVTNAQWEVFVQHPEGYRDARWWLFSPYARQWHDKNPNPRNGRFGGETRPRESANWYEAMAFSKWLSAFSGWNITLPTQSQWRRAAQGDDGRLYPWGDTFDPQACNSRESKIRVTTVVDRYDNGLSPFRIYDMAGNVWEWCLNGSPNAADPTDPTALIPRAVLGGSFMSSALHLQTNFHFYLAPDYHYTTIGFRIAALGTPPR